MQRKNGMAANHLTARRQAPRFAHMTRKGRFVPRTGLFDIWPDEPVRLPRHSKSVRTIASRASRPQRAITVVNDGLYDQNGQAVPTFAAVTTQGAAEVDDVQQIVTAPGGTFSLSYNGNATAAQNAGESAATLQTALQAVPGLAQVAVTGAGTAASPYLVTFGGELKGENVPPLTAVGATLNSIATTYDNAGQITAVGDNYSHYAYTYDGHGNTASVDNGGSPDSPRVVLASQYDAAGNRESLAATLYNGGTAEPDFINNYSYDALSRLTVMQQQRQNQPGANAVAAREIDYAYNGLGEVTSRAGFNFIGVGPRQDMATGNFTYDSTTGLLTGLSYTSHGGATAIDNFTWTYDTLARVKTFSSIDGTATYGYDSRSEVTSAGYTTAAGGHQPANESFSFDANGNRPVASGGTIVNNEVSDDGTFKYTFDADGNRLTRTRDSGAAANDHQVSYSYDYRNRLVEVRDYNNSGTLTEQIDYTYDVFDHLIERVDDVIGGATTSTQYIWDNLFPLPPGEGQGEGGIVLSFDDGALSARNLNGPNTSAADQYFTTLAEEHVTSLGSPGTLTFDLPDDEGTLRDIADANGNPADHLVYTVFGQLAYESAPTVAHIDGYAGGLYDPSMQLVYFIHRWYDPAATVWISADPLGFAAGDANLTRYVANGATDATDPSGDITIYIHGVNTDNKGYDELRQKARAAFPAAPGECDEQVVDLNWAYLGANGKVINPTRYASDAIGQRTDAKNSVLMFGMSKQQWQGVDKLSIIIGRLRRLIDTYPCLKGEEINIVAHSQGTLITLAALQNGQKADNVIFMGSPMDRETVADTKHRARHNTNLVGGCANTKGIHNLWSTSDDTARYKGGIGGFGLPPSVISPTLTDTELKSVDHYGDAGWWAGNWLDNQSNRSKVDIYFRAVLYTQGCGTCDAAAEAAIQKELEAIQADASSYMPQPGKKK